MSESTSSMTDDVVIEHVSAEAVAEVDDAVTSTVEDAPVEDTLEEALDEAVESDASDQRLVINTEAGWTAQSQHGVLLPHEVPSQDYALIAADPAERTDVAVDADW